MDLCRHVKNDPSQRHIRVVLTAGLLEPFDEEEATRAGCDAILKKPFEASKVMETIHPLVKEAQLARGLFAEALASAAATAPARYTGPRPFRTTSIRSGFGQRSRWRWTRRCRR